MITDDHWDALAKKRQSYSDGAYLPSGTHAKYIEALDAILALRPEPVRPWRPGDWCSNEAWPQLVVLVADDEGRVLTVDWNDTEPEAGFGDAEWWSVDKLHPADPPDSWVAAGRPGAPAPAGTPSGVWYCRTHHGIANEVDDMCDVGWDDAHDEGSCRWTELLLADEGSDQDAG